MPKGRAKKKLKKYSQRSSDKKVSETSLGNMNSNSGSYVGTGSLDETSGRSSSRSRFSDCFQRFARIANTFVNRTSNPERIQSDSTRHRDIEGCASEQHKGSSQVSRKTKPVQTRDLFEAVQNLCNPNKRLHIESFTPKTIRICLGVHHNITSVLIEMFNDQPSLIDSTAESCGRFQSQLILNLLTEGNFAGWHHKTIKTGRDKDNEIKRRACRIHGKEQTEAVTRQIRPSANLLEWLSKTCVYILQQQMKNTRTQYSGEMKTLSSEEYSNDCGEAQHIVIKATVHPWNNKSYVPAAVVELSNRTSKQLYKEAENPSPVIRFKEATCQPHWNIKHYKPSVARPADIDSRQYFSTTKGGSSLTPDQIGGSVSRLELFGKTQTSLKEDLCISFEFEERKHSVFLPSMKFQKIMDILREQIVITKRGPSMNVLEIPNKSVLSCRQNDLMKITIDKPGLKRLTIESVPATLLRHFAQRISNNNLIRATKYIPDYSVEEPLQTSASAVEHLEQRLTIVCRSKISELEMKPETRRPGSNGVINTNVLVTQRQKLPITKSSIRNSHQHNISISVKNGSKVRHILWQPLHPTWIYVRDPNKGGLELLDAQVKESKIHPVKENWESARTLVKNGAGGEREDDESDETEPGIIYDTKESVEDRKIYGSNHFKESNFGGGTEGQSARGIVDDNIKAEPDEENAVAKANELNDEDWLAKIRGATSKRRGEFQAFKSQVPQNLDQIAVPVMKKDDIIVVTDDDGDEMLLSSGGFGKVYVARLRASEELIVAKLIQDLSFEEVLMEARVQMYLMSGSYTPEILGIIGSPGRSEKMILQELCADGRTLNEVIQLCDSGALILFEKHWLDLAHKLVINLNDMHNKGVLHNDIKPNNILVEIKPNVVRPVFIDFGWASFRRGEVFESNSGAEIHGSKAKYLAPEVRKGRLSSAKSDIYSLGKLFMDIADLFCEDLRLLALRMSADQPKRRPSLEKTADRIEELIVRKGF